MPETKPPAKRVREIVLEALETGSLSERRTLLDSRCGGDAVLRENVDAMLAETDQLDGFLETPPAVEMQEWRDGKKSSEHIGPYKLLQEVGEGGCGVVYMAEQESPVRRRVALKIIKLGMDTKSVIARFESERQALAMMDHPNIAKVLDAGATENGRPYFVMELVRGVRITDYCDQHKLTTEDRLKLFVCVSQAIQHAHQKGIIHRDIKPSNILVTLHDGAPIPKIIDFGIAKAVDQRLTDKTLFTEFHSFIGTPAYMSPEQAEMSGLDIDTRSDIYALGVLLYELLVGSTPFDPTALHESGLDECRRTIREDEPAKPSQRLSTLVDADRQTIAAQRVTEGQLLVSRLRGDLDWIVMKCLDKDRQRRYATANALAHDVQRYLDGDLVTARPPSTLYRLQKSWRRNRLALTAATAVLTALVLGIGASTWLAIRATTAEQESNRLRIDAELGQRQAVENADRARLNEYVADMNVANYSLENGNLGRAWQLLEKHRAEADGHTMGGFEWRYLADQSQGDEHFAYPPQGDSIQSLSFSHDGVLLAVGMDDEIKIWDVRSHAHIVTLPRGGRSLAFLDSTNNLVSTDGEALSIWHTTTWLEQLNLPARTSKLIVSNDGKLLACIERGERRRRGHSRDGKLRIWDTASWEEIVTEPGLSGTLAFSPDSRTLAVGSREEIILWDISTRSIIRTLEHSAVLSGFRSPFLAFSPDGKMVVAPRNDRLTLSHHVLGLWDASSGRALGILPDDIRGAQHTSTISILRWSPDGRKVFTGSWDHSIQVWDVAGRSHIGSLRGHRNEVWAMAMDPKGETVASGGKDGQLLLWPAEISRKKDSLEGYWEPLSFSSDSSKFAAKTRDRATRNHTVTIFQTESLEASQTFELGTLFAISPDLETLATRDDEGTITIRDLATQAAQFLSLGEHRPSSLTLSPNGRYLIADGSRHHQTTWWDLLKPDEPLLTIDAGNARFSSDGTTVIFLPPRRGDIAEVWDVGSISLRTQLTLPEIGMGWALSPKGDLLAMSTGANNYEHAIHLWDTHSGLLTGSCRGHKQGIWAVAFTPDGKTLASTSDDSTLKLWNVTTQQELLSLKRPGATISRLIFSPDGQWLATSPHSFSSEGALRLIHAPSPK